MAGDWIKMRMDLQTHPKIVRIMSATCSDKFRVIGGLHAVWCIFDQHSDNGELRGYSPEMMDTVIGWNGLSDALISVGWLEHSDETLVMPEFDSHNGKSAKRRADDTKRKREARLCPQDVRKMSANDQEKLGTREEKRREDKDSKPKTPVDRKTTFDSWVATIKISGEKPIPDNHAVITYADDAGIPQEYLAICWEHFKGRYTGDPKKYIDWRKVFHNAVRENWFKLWWLDAGEYKLTSVGQQGLIALKNKKGDQ